MAVLTDSIDERISARYAGLSAKLRTAADYVAKHPLDVATRSLRSVAETSGVSPATFSRLARVLGYADYEEMREAGRASVGRRIIPFSDRAQTLRDGSHGDWLNGQAMACSTNIAYLDQNIPRARLEAAVQALLGAETVLLFGAMGSAGIIDHFAYQAQWFTRGWHVAERGASPSAILNTMVPGDVVFVLSMTPYVPRAIHALRLAREAGLTTIAVTDSHSSPALEFADHGFVVPTESPNFFSSYASTLVLFETMITMLLTRAGPEALDRIRATEDQVRALGESWPT